MQLFLEPCSLLNVLYFSTVKQAVELVTKDILIHNMYIYIVNCCYSIIKKTA